MTTHDESRTPCYACGRRAGYNRAVQDRRTDRQLGRLCVDCERRHVDDWIDADRSERRCCDRAGRYALPKYESIAVETESIVLSTVSTAVDSEPLLLCRSHLRALCDRTAGTRNRAVLARQRAD